MTIFLIELYIIYLLYHCRYSSFFMFFHSLYLHQLKTDRVVVIYFFYIKRRIYYNFRNQLHLFKTVIVSTQMKHICFTWLNGLFLRRMVMKFGCTQYVYLHSGREMRRHKILFHMIL